MAGSPLHFVGSLPPSDHLKLMAVSAGATGSLTRRPSPLSPPSRAVPAPLVASTGSSSPIRRTARLTAPGFSQTLAKACGQLAGLSARLEGGKAKKDRAGLEAEIARILAPRWLNRVISFELTGDSPAATGLLSASRSRPARHSKPSCSESGCCSPTATTGPSPRSLPPTAPSRVSRRTSDR